MTSNKTESESSFIVGREVGRRVIDGSPYYVLPVRLPSYRSLPLSCVEDVRVEIAGETVARDRLYLRLDGISFRIDQLCSLSSVWWWILDVAEILIVPGPEGGPEVRGVRVEITTVEPYLSAGRFSFVNLATAAMTFASTGAN